MQIVDFNENNGLVYCQNWAKAKNNAERLYISEVLQLKAHAVLFRRFYEKDGSPIPYHSEPAVCIFKEVDYSFNSKEHKSLHAALWSSGKNEIYIILGKTRIDIMNARKPAEAKGKELSLENLRLVTSAIKGFNDQRFSAYLFGSGTFWEQTKFEDQVNEKNSPYIYLLEYLMTVRKEFLCQKNILSIDTQTIDKLLIICILVKFLEEIKDDNGKHTLHDIYKKHKVNNFAEVIEKNHTIAVLNELAAEFNGQIFNGFSDAEKDKISSANLNLLAQFLRADIDLKTKQYFLWEQYSFKYLPAEVISAIYENFVQAESERNNGETEKGVVYTPIHLVNFLIDEVMPLENSKLFINNNFRILDPSCGSGVFLVAAYKRLMQWWAINNSSPGNIQYPQSKDAQRILEDNIFGVDVKDTATLVSIFSLTTALLNKLTPKEIWNNFKFKDLSLKNIKQQNFFEWAVEARQNGETFDLVVGNPPFNIETGKKKEDVLAQDILSKLNFKHEKIPGNNFALHFFECSMTLARKVCLITPSNIVLYNKAAQQYRESLFTDFTIDNIFDFTHLRRDLFHRSADTPVVALVAENKPSTFQPIKHTIIKREASSEKKIRFEITEYDSHIVPYNWATDEGKQFIWKTNLLGGGRLFHLIYRLSLLENFKEFINKQMRSNSEWKYSVGYKLNGYKKKPNIDYIFGKPSIITESFDENESFLTFIEENRDFSEPRNPKIYEPPHLIFKVNLGRENIPIHYSENYLCFKDKLVGLHSPKEKKDILMDIYNKFKNKEYSKLSKLWILSTSAESLVNLETACKKEDIDSLPFSIDTDCISMSDSEKILQNDILNYYVHNGKSIGKNSSGRILHEKANQTQIEEFGEIFCDTLNSIYEKEGQNWQLGHIYQTEIFTICQFGFGGKGKLARTYSCLLDDEIRLLVEDRILNSGAIYKRIVRIYQSIEGFDCVYLVKPNALRYWLKSIALRDADDTFVDFKNHGF